MFFFCANRRPQTLIFPYAGLQHNFYLEASKRCLTATSDSFLDLGTTKDFYFFFLMGSNNDQRYKVEKKANFTFCYPYDNTLQKHISYEKTQSAK